MNLVDHDVAFMGLDMTLDPAILDKGIYSLGEHVRMDGGTLVSRRGNLCVPWADDWQLTRTYQGRPIRSHGEILDAIKFSNPSGGGQVIVFVTAEGGFVVSPGSVCVKLAFPSGYATPEGGRLVQAFNEVFWLSPSRALRWRGDTAVGWELLHFDPGDLGGGFLGFPETDRGCYYNNRLYLKQDDNSLIVSDILAPERFSILNEFYVNAGDADEIRSIVPYVNNRVLVFKDNSIYSLDGLTGDLSGAAINQVGLGVGTVSDRSIQVLGQEVFWLARQGVYRAALAYEQRLTPTTVPFSEPVKKIVDRINWENAGKAVSLVNRDRYYLAVPLDDSTSNNCVMVYNIRMNGWESIDIHEPFTFTRKHNSAQTYGDGFGPQALVNARVFTREAIIGFTSQGCIFLKDYNRGKPDISIEHTTDIDAWGFGLTIPTSSYNELAINKVSFDTIMQTRGYLAGDTGTKTGGHIEMTISTHDPEFDVDIVTKGPNEKTEIKHGITRDRTKRLNFSDSTTGGLPQAHTEPFLEDYSIHLTSSVNNESTGLVTDFYFGDDEYDDVEVGQEQEFQERFRVIKRFRAPRVRLTSSKGIVRLSSVMIKEIQRFNRHRREV